eukprot:gene14715-10525_t
MEKWVTVSVLGRGRFGCCHLVQQENENSTSFACLKTITENERNSFGDRVRRLRFEYELLLSFHHHHSHSHSDGAPTATNSAFPFVIRTSGWQESKEESLSPGLLLSLGENGTLAQHMRHGSVSLALARLYCSEICCALHHLHAYPAGPIVHRDIKASNILLGSRGHCLLSDFGAAKVLSHSPASSSSSRTRTMPIGTEHALAPEMVACLSPDAGGDGYDESVDYWALGILCFELVTGGGLPAFRDSQTLSLPRIEAAVDALRWDKLVDAAADKSSVGNWTAWWQFSAVDDLFTTHFPSSRFASSYPPERIAGWSLEKLASLLHMDEETSLRAAHAFIVAMLTVSPSERRARARSMASTAGGSTWIYPADSEAFQRLSTRPVALDSRLGCVETLQHLRRQASPSAAGTDDPSAAGVDPHEAVFAAF